MAWKRGASSDKLRDAENPHILRKNKGVNIDGDRTVYTVVAENPQKTTYLVRSTGYVAVGGAENQTPNFHASEPPNNGEFTVTDTVLAEDFVAI